MKQSLLAICLLGAVSLYAGVGMKVHKVVKGETLFSISKQYGLTTSEVVKANPELKHNTHIKIGQRLVVPGSGITNTTAMAKIKTHAVASTPNTPYSDEENTSREKSQSDQAIATTNNEPVLVEKPKAPEPAFISLRTTSSNAAEYPAIFGQYMAHGYKAKRNRGAANYLPDNTSGNQYLAFYNDAESGSVIKVTNMMNKKTVYVKVIGKVPYADASQEIILKVSNKAAHDLGALDEKFLVEVLGCSN